MRRAVPPGRLPGDWLATRGLSTAEAEARRRQYGDNDVALDRSQAWWAELADTVRDPMLWFLAFTSGVYGLVGERVEALTLLGAIVPLVGMDLYLHRRTFASTRGLQRRLAATACVLRGEDRQEIPATAVVPGDLALVTPGQYFPADGIIVESADLQVDESTVTGESFPVGKQALRAGSSGHGDVPVDDVHWGVAGTRVLTGTASLRVVFTGADTLYGAIARSAAHGTQPRTPLQTALAHLVRVLVVTATGLCVVVGVARWLQGHGWVDALLSAVTLAAAALPEEFPVVFAFFLGVGVYRLARRQALVRRAVSVENIGRVSVICSDKTGTLTEGQLRLGPLVVADGLAEARLLELAAWASRADSQDPLDAAILARTDTPGGTVLASFPFTEGRRLESAVIRDGGDRLLAAVKGAPETVLARCALPPAERAAWDTRVAALAAAGLKVIACGSRELEPTDWDGHEVEAGYTVAGLLAFEDRVREGVADAVALCRDAGIRTIMVTGDHALAAGVVARQLGLGGGSPVVVTGDDLERDVGRGGYPAAAAADVVARATPAQKLVLVRALQEAGALVAVTGDGVNDVPALQAADIGIAMGERGTVSAREAAAIVLLDDNFRTIVRAIGEGRQLFRNLQRSFAYLLMVHVPLVLTAVLVPLAGYPLLYLPVHIVWLELLIHPTALFAFQGRPDPRRLVRLKSGRRARFFEPADVRAIGVVGALGTVAVTAGYLMSLAGGGGVPHARAMALAILTLASAALALALARPGTWTAWAVASATALGTVSLVQIPASARLLQLSPLPADDWLLATGAAVVLGLIAAGVEAR